MSEMQSQHWALDIEAVEAYVLHRLNIEKEREYSEHLYDCEECRQRVQKERNLMIGIRRFGRMEMKRRLQHQIHHSQSRQFEWAQVASVAAAVVLMVGAVFALRWLTDFEQSKTKTQEINLQKSETAQRPLWITGKIVLQQRTFRGTSSDKGGSFIVKQGNMTQTISVRYAQLAELPPTLKTDDESVIHTMVERTSRGLQLTLYADLPDQTMTTGIEAISADSLIVFLKEWQIAYHIPGGWAGNM